MKVEDFTNGDHILFTIYIKIQSKIEIHNLQITNSVYYALYNISEKKRVRSEWGSNPRPTATLPSTKYQCSKSNPLSQITIPKKDWFSGQ
jgi:hypothetical protein